MNHMKIIAKKCFDCNRPLYKTDSLRSGYCFRHRPLHFEPKLNPIEDKVVRAMLAWKYNSQDYQIRNNYE